MLRRVALACLAPCALAACWLTIDESKIPGGPDASATDAGTPPPDAASDAIAEDAGAACPSGMVVAPTLDGGAYCIDATEVTVAQYAAYMRTNPTVSSLEPPSVCAWNTTATPNSWNAQLAGDDALPLEGSNWCQAYAYCKWAGKHLCGAIGGGGAIDPGAPSNDPHTSEWFNACSAGGKRAFPYGSTYAPQNCVDVDHSPKPTGPAQAGKTAACAGGVPGLFDMSGNLAEWEDACDATGSAACGSSGPECAVCRVRGGSFTQDAGWVDCAGPDGAYRNAQLAEVGFRCCAK